MFKRFLFLYRLHDWLHLHDMGVKFTKKRYMSRSEFDEFRKKYQEREDLYFSAIRNNIYRVSEEESNRLVQIGWYSNLSQILYCNFDEL